MKVQLSPKQEPARRRREKWAAILPAIKPDDPRDSYHLPMRPRHAIALALVLATGAGCATTRSVSEDRDVIHVSATRFPSPGDTVPTLGWGTGPAAKNEPIIGARCTVSNDRGSWSVTTPGPVEVELSSALVHVTCRREGFRDESVDLYCASPRRRATAAGALVGLPLGASAGAAAIFAGPGAVAAAVLGPMVLGGAAGYALSGADTVRCELAIYMTPEP
jgi:hypothetical protein